MLRITVGIALLIAQLGMMVYARFDDARYYCWAPHDSQCQYQIRVTLNGAEFTPKQIDDRYHIRPTGVDPRAIEHVKRLIRQYERTYGKHEPAEVVLIYRTNGGPEQEWRWPPT